jgi:hypothetical protein
MPCPTRRHVEWGGHGGVARPQAVLSRVLPVGAEADDIVTTSPAERERHRPGARGEMRDGVVGAAESSR